MRFRVEQMLLARPFTDFEHLIERANQIWWDLSSNDWIQAFSAHPKIGDTEAVKKKEAAAGGKASWEGDEQSGANSASDATKNELRALNSLYDQRFGFVFLICATGKSAEEMLNALRERVNNSKEQEVRMYFENCYFSN